MNLDTTSCKTEAGGGCYQGGPLWLQEASVVPAVTTPHLSSRLLVRQPGSLPANGKHAAAQRDLVRVRPRGSSSLCDACTDPQSRGSAGSLGHRGGGGGGVAASAPEASRLHSNTWTHICIFFFLSLMDYSFHVDFVLQSLENVWEKLLSAWVLKLALSD